MKKNYSHFFQNWMGEGIEIRRDIMSNPGTALNFIYAKMPLIVRCLLFYVSLSKKYCQLHYDIMLTLKKTIIMHV